MKTINQYDLYVAAALTGISAHITGAKKINDSEPAARFEVTLDKYNLPTYITVKK